MVNVVICDDDKKLTKEYQNYVSEMKDKISQLTVYNSAQKLYDDLNFFGKSFENSQGIFCFYKEEIPL